MSATPAPAGASPVVCPSSPSPASMSVTWARAVGAGSIRRDFGHHIATNAAGEVLLAARLERIDGGALDGDAEPVSGERTLPAGLDLATGSLVKLARGGGPAWRLLLRNTGVLGAPTVALDDAGAAYVAGPYAPDDAGLSGAHDIALTKLAPGGAAEWTRPLLVARPHEGRPWLPVVRVAADPAGGACVTWIGERRGVAVVRALRVSDAGSIEWEYAWPITGEVFDPHIGVDGGGAALVWGTFRGAVSFAPGRCAWSPVKACYLARVEPDEGVTWALPVPTEGDASCAVGLGRSGAIGLAMIVTSAAHKGSDRRRKLALVRLDATGAPLKHLHGVGGAHTLLSSPCIASTGGDTFAVGGYLSGTLTLEGATLRSASQAGEAVLVACIGPDGSAAALTLPVPQLFGGLSIHGLESGAMLAGGWVSGTVKLGKHTITSPRGRAEWVLAKLVRG